MKIPFSIPCTQCKTNVDAYMDLEASSLTFDCPHGHPSFYSLDLSFTIGVLLLRRAEFEISRNKDYSMSVVISAMAFECELSRLHHKCEQLAALEASKWLDDSALDKKLRKYRNIGDRIEEICRLLYAPGIDDFVSGMPDLKEAVIKASPHLSFGTLARSFQESLFWPRNRILHLGETIVTRDNALELLNMATIGVVILNRMDERKWPKSMA
jgi:hypothetical protein